MSRAEMRTHAAPAPARFVDAIRVRAFGVPFLAEIQSIVGDQLARVALSYLVFRQTGSAAATGATFAATYLPAVVGGAVLGPLGDRFRRRSVMVAVDVVRAVLVAGMAVPGSPLPVIAALLVLAVFVGPLFNSAEVSYLAKALEPELFRVANGLRLLTGQAAQVAGFALGGVLVAAWGPRAVLAVDAGTFIVSVLLIGLAAPTAADTVGDTAAATVPDEPAAAPARTLLWRSRRLRALVALSALAGFFTAPEGLAVPFAAHWDSSPARAGILLAAMPLGSVVGVLVLVRGIARPRREVASHAMAIGCGLPLVASAWAPTFELAVACWFVSGACAAYQVEVVTQLVHAVPDRLRARSLGIANAILLGSQGLGLAAFGSIAEVVSAAAAVALAGAGGAAGAVWLVWSRRRSSADAVRTA